MDQNQSNASGYYRQPARSLLIDLSPPFSPSVCREVCSGLENLLSMVCSLSGQSRVPFLSISALGAFPEILLPLQHVRGNFSRIQCAVEEIQRVFDDSQSVSTKLSDSCLLQALEDICTQFKRQTKMMMQTSGQWSQLEIVVISGQNSTKLSKQIDRVTATLNLENLRRIQVVSLNDEMMIIDETGDPGIGSQKSSHSEGSSEGAGLGILVDSIQIDSDKLSVQSYFNSWLKDVATDREHLHIILPSPSKGNPQMTLKCDLQERIINPQLLQGLSLSIHKEPLSAAPKPNQQGGSKSAEPSPLYEILVKKMIPSAALCESIVFGMPLIVQPTSCWKIDWEELEQNQQNFQSLCQTLSEKDAVLLGSCFMPGFKQKSTSQIDINNFSAWFVILPARNSLLIKSLAVNELMLPCNAVFQTEKPSDESKARVTQSLEQVETCEMYNPLLTTSGLYNVLKSQYRKPLPNKQPRRKFNYQPKQDDRLDARGGNIPGANVTFKRFCPPGSFAAKSSFPTEL